MDCKSLNPLSAGKSVQTTCYLTDTCKPTGLNPLSAGKSVQTGSNAVVVGTPVVLIPYQQGSLFRLYPLFFLL